MSDQFEPLREASDSLRAGRYREAVGLLEQLVREAPENAETHEQLGLACSLSGDLERALEAFEAAARLDSGCASIRYNIGVSHREAGRLLKAAESFAETIRLDEKFYPGWIGQAGILVTLGDFPGAREAAQTAARLQPQEESPWRLLILVELLEGNLPAVGEALEGYRVVAGDLADVFPHLRELLGEQRAIELARVVLARRAMLAREAALLLGEHYYRQGEADAAIACLLDARSLGTDDARTLILLSGAYSLRGRTAEAETALRLATALEPQNPAAWLQRGILLSNLGKHEEAVEAFRTGTRVAPADGTGWYYLGVALVQTGQREEAIHAYREAARLGPESSRALNNLGAIYASLDREGEARRAYEEAVLHNPMNGRAWGNLGLLLAQRGDREGAIRHLREALRLRPERADLSIVLLELESETPPPPAEVRD